MKGPRWLYLTHAYVVALGLERFPVKLRRSKVLHDPRGPMLAAPPSPYVEGVRLDGALYLRDGKSWRLA